MGQLSTPNTFVAGTAAKASEVNANFQAVESVVNGNIDTTNLKDVSVTTGKLADSAVTTAKIADDAVTSAKIPEDAVTSAQIADGAVTGSQIGALEVTTAHLADDAVTLAKMADSSVDTAQLVDGAVTSDKIGSDVHPVLGGNTVYSVYVSTGQHDGTQWNVSASSLPDNWTVEQTDEGAFTVTHNLDLERLGIQVVDSYFRHTNGSEDDYTVDVTEVTRDGFSVFVGTGYSTGGVVLILVIVPPFQT